MAASTPAAYAAPEAEAGAPASQAADVYAFGLTLLQLLAASEAGGLAAHAAAVLRAGGGGAQRLADPCAGAWPAAQAADLARLALRCALHALQGVEEAALRAWGPAVVQRGCMQTSILLLRANVHCTVAALVKWLWGAPALAPTLWGRSPAAVRYKLSGRARVLGRPCGVNSCSLLCAAVPYREIVCP